MNIEVRAPQREQTSKLQIIDCDFHPKITHDQMRPFLSNQWWSYLQTFGNRSRHGYAKGYAYPKMTPQAARRDAWPPNGGLPASDLDFVRQQHLDFYGIETAIMNSLLLTGQGDQNVELSIVLAAAAEPRALPMQVIYRAEVVRRGSRSGSRSAKEYAARRANRRPGCPSPPHRPGRRSKWRGRSDQAAVEAGLPVGIDVLGHAAVALLRPQFWLSIVLHRGDDRARHRGAGHGHELHHGRRVRALSGGRRSGLIECGFGWLPSLGSPSRTLEAAQGRGAAPQEGAVGIHPRALLRQC